MTQGQKKNFITTKVVQSPEEMQGVTSLWREVYGLEFGWLEADASPYTDGFHERSTYYISYLNETEPVGTMRIVHANKVGFHITDAKEINALKNVQTQSVEVQRLMVKRNFRDKRLEGAPFGVYGCMVKACLHHSIAHGIDLVLADCHRDMDISPMKSMLQMGFEDTGETYIDDMNGLTCSILTMQTKSWIQSIYANRSKFNRYLLAIGDWSALPNGPRPFQAKYQPMVEYV